jgi:hypothetical protein
MTRVLQNSGTTSLDLFVDIAQVRSILRAEDARAVMQTLTTQRTDPPSNSPEQSKMDFIETLSKPSKE